MSGLEIVISGIAAVTSVPLAVIAAKALLGALLAAMGSRNDP
jgi:hypothetical protein